MPFFKSLKRELGKNTGKWLSNKLFGDSHATPVKLVRKKEKNLPNKSQNKFPKRNS